MLIAAAALIGKARSRLSDYGSRNTADFMPIDVVLALETVTRGLPGWPLVTRQLAAATGHILIAVPDCPPSAGDLADAIACHAREAGEATAAALATIDQGLSTAAARKKALQEVDESIEASVRLRALIACEGT